MGRRESVASSAFKEDKIIGEFEALKKELELSKGEGSIIIVVINSWDILEKLILKLSSEFKTKVIRVESSQQIVNILKRENLDADVVIWILPDEVDNDILSALNNFRELFYKKPFPSVIVCNFDALEKIITHAPDFWRYRSSIYDLSIEKDTETVSLYLLPMIKGTSRPYNKEKLDKREKTINYLLSIAKDENERARLLGELATVYLAKYYITNDRQLLEKAEALIKKALARVKSVCYKFDLLLWLGIIYAINGNTQRAKEVFDKLRKEESGANYQDTLNIFRKVLASFAHFIIKIEELKLKLEKSKELDKNKLHEIRQTIDKIRNDIREWAKHEEDMLSLLVYISELQSLSEIYVAMKQYKDAEETLKEALKLAVKYRDKNIIGSIYLDLANLYFIMGNLEKAKKYVEYTLSIGEETKDELLIKNAKKLLDKIKTEN